MTEEYCRVTAIGIRKGSGGMERCRVRCVCLCGCVGWERIKRLKEGSVPAVSQHVQLVNIWLQPNLQTSARLRKTHRNIGFLAL